MEPIKLHSNKIIAGFVLLCGVFITVAAISVGMEAYLIVGPVFIVLGILLFTNPTIVITDTEIQMRNLFGMTLKRYSYTKETVEVKGRKLFVNGKKINLGASGAMHGRDVNRAILHFEGL